MVDIELVALRLAERIIKDAIEETAARPEAVPQEGPGKEQHLGKRVEERVEEF